MGFPIIADNSSSRVFRQLQGGEDSEIEVNFFGQPAVQAVQDAEAAPPPKDAQVADVDSWHAAARWVGGVAWTDRQSRQYEGGGASIPRTLR